jgi:hypothetical protein
LLWWRKYRGEKNVGASRLKLGKGNNTEKYKKSRGHTGEVLAKCDWLQGLFFFVNRDWGHKGPRCCHSLKVGYIYKEELN